ncbi:hypothetical protein BJ741DRAFT_709697 [Chytriomyces cf. hyalinus JEL632]|nr:hypothetical protein BJ741DRAFT_709697 [Chytriomyces cf. hyalinus JEL632]
MSSRAENSSTTIGTVQYTGCFRGKRDTNIVPFKAPVSNLRECAAFCPSPLHDDPYFMMLYIDDAFSQQCGCSTMCLLAQAGENMVRVSDMQCSFPCKDTGTLCGGVDSAYTYFAVYSISPKSKACSEREITVPLNRPVQLVSYTGLALNVLLLLVFFCFVHKEESRREPLREWRKQFASPFNIQLLAMALSLIGIYICLIVETRSLEPIILYLLPVNYFLSATFKTFFILYSWGRGSAVINSVWPGGTQYFQILICASPVLLYSNVVSIILYAYYFTTSPIIMHTTSLISRYLDMSAIAAVFLIDFGLLVCFVIHIRQNTRVSQTDALSPRFLSICYYGIAANIFCITSFVIFIVRFVTRDTSFHNTVPEYMMDAIIHLVFTAVLAILLGLKVSLQWESERETRSKLSAQERAKVIASGGAFEGPSNDNTRMNSKSYAFE